MTSSLKVRRLETFLNSPRRFAALELATTLDVPPMKLAPTLYKACVDLDKLERLRKAWRDPAQVLQSPSVAALYQVACARLGRVAGVARRRRLETLCQKLERAWERVRDRAWIEAFIGPPLAGMGSSSDRANG